MQCNGVIWFFSLRLLSICNVMTLSDSLVWDYFENLQAFLLTVMTGNDENIRNNAKKNISRNAAKFLTKR